ncbi:phosphate transporter family protein [Hirsutella rhossiliensis]|uniref:Phosphate transporter n=1 Tax=Hirsutella rhossiliensis TaxID=111463 RepID=A0A9P8N744_9HYPO|nr:phosphate transporter family domain-containing protein [Hirsutella rhossiliensis]KAH0968175.1 phosphate transporter family domain-containing protein [Hirsutella rhossiliensis]
MSALHQYDYIFAITSVLAALDAWNIGANDVANAFASSVSSRSLTLKQAMALASVCEFSGSVTVGSRVTEMVRKAIVNPHHFDDAPAVLLLAMMCTIMSSSIFLTVATRKGMPVMPTHSLLGGLIGSGIASIGVSKINWGWTGVSRVIAAWVISPGFAGLLGAALFLFTRTAVLCKAGAVKRAFFSIPFYSFITFGALATLVVWEGMYLGTVPTKIVLISIFAAATGGVLLESFFVMPWLWARVVRDDWTLKGYHAFQGPFLLWRRPPPPTPRGAIKPHITDFYRGHLTPEELQFVRASEKLLQSVQTSDGKPPPTHDDDEEPILPPPAQSPPPGWVSRLDPESEALTPPRPPGSGTSWPVIRWRIGRIFLRGVERDVISMQKCNALLEWDIADMHSRARRYDNRAEYMFSTLQVITAAATSFTHGANDVSNAIAPFSVAYEVWSEGRVPEMTNVPIWQLCFGGAVIVLGLLTFGYHVMRTLGNRLTLVSPSRGFCMELASAITVLVATRLRLPVSTTQCIVGATVGVGLANGDWRCINLKLTGQIYLGWLVTLPVTGFVSWCLMGMLLNAPSWPGA